MTAHRLRLVLFTLLAIVLALALVEGLASGVLFLRDLAGRGGAPVAERAHTAYDPELGWVNVPSRRVEDLYGPGRTLTVNAQGFRGTRDVTPDVAPGKVRILCSGDSFTLGWGVDDADTWCARLEGLDPRLETVNMGQGGYGVDQAYLWAMRDGPALEHQVHLFAVISGDIERMRYDRFEGYGKPVLAMRDGRPVADRVPVPRRAFWIPWLARHEEALGGLRVVQALRRLRGVPTDAGAPEAVWKLSEATRLAVEALRVLAAEDRERGARLVVVWLPTIFEVGTGTNERLRVTFLDGVRAAGIEAIDLSADFGRLERAELESLFQTQEGLTLPVGGRHYSARGNAFVARAIWRELRGMPPFAAGE